MNIADIKQQSTDELQKTLIGLREEQFKLRMSKASGQLTHTHQQRVVRRDIARVKTVLRQQKQGN